MTHVKVVRIVIIFVLLFFCCYCQILGSNNFINKNELPISKTVPIILQYDIHDIDLIFRSLYRSSVINDIFHYHFVVCIAISNSIGRGIFFRCIIMTLNLCNSFLIYNLLLVVDHLELVFPF